MGYDGPYNLIFWTGFTTFHYHSRGLLSYQFLGNKCGEFLDAIPYGFADPKEFGERIFGHPLSMAPKHALRSEEGQGEASMAGGKKGKGVMRKMCEH